MKAQRQLLEDPPSGRIGTTCNQDARTHYLTQHHYELWYRETPTSAVFTVLWALTQFRAEVKNGGDISPSPNM
jgi:hypothetical protein